MSVGPMEESMNELRGVGFLVDITERRNPITKKLNDLFGFIDFVGIHDEYGIVGVQATTRDHFSERLDKIMNDRRERAISWLRAGRGASSIWVVGWGKLKNPPAPKRHHARETFGRFSTVVLDEEKGLKEIPMIELGGSSWMLSEGHMLHFPMPEERMSH